MTQTVDFQILWSQGSVRPRYEGGEGPAVITGYREGPDVFSSWVEGPDIEGPNVYRVSEGPAVEGPSRQEYQVYCVYNPSRGDTGEPVNGPAYWAGSPASCASGYTQQGDRTATIEGRDVEGPDIGRWVEGPDIEGPAIAEYTEGQDLPVYGEGPDLPDGVLPDWH